jgi:hypothetical protein
MKKKTVGRVARIAATLKAPRLTHLVRHPIKGPKNLLALRGAKSLIMTRAAAITAAAATTALAVPLAVKAWRNNSSS